MDFTLRRFKESDAEVFASHANNPNVANNLTDRFPHPYTAEHALFFFRNMVANEKNVIRAIAIKEEPCGGIGVHQGEDVHRKNGELGYWLAEPYWGNGIISRAIPMIVREAFSILEIERIYARPFGSNIASQKVLIKAGFKFQANLPRAFYKNGKFEDELIFAVYRDEIMLES